MISKLSFLHHVNILQQQSSDFTIRKIHIQFSESWKNTLNVDVIHLHWNTYARIFIIPWYMQQSFIDKEFFQIPIQFTSSLFYQQHYLTSKCFMYVIFNPLRLKMYSIQVAKFWASTKLTDILWSVEDIKWYCTLDSLNF